MDNQVIKAMIYNQLYLAKLYEDISNEQLKNDAYYNASLLERYYQEYNTSSYNPILYETIKHETFKENIEYILDYLNKSQKLYIPYQDIDIVDYILNVLIYHHKILNNYIK